MTCEVWQRAQVKRERGGVGVGGRKARRERQPICLGDDSPMLGIYSIRREGRREGWREEVWGKRSEGGGGGGKRFGRRPRRHHSTTDGERRRERRRPQR